MKNLFLYFICDLKWFFVLYLEKLKMMAILGSVGEALYMLIASMGKEVS